MDRAWFDHRDHGNSVTACGTCHAAETSDRASDLLLPGIAVCRDCHAGAHPEKGKVTSSCASCHSYHEAPGAPRVLKAVGADRRTPGTTEQYKSRDGGGARPAR
jgi:predicted CXXCH cytochrome family protein